MGEAERYIEYKHVKRSKRFLLGEDNNALVGLFTLNVIFFLLLLTLQVGYYFYQQTPALFYSQVIQSFSLPNSFVGLIEKPWTLLTYMFSDSSQSLMRIVSNMLWLWAFGAVLQSMGGNNKIIPIYIYGGVLGGIFFISANYFFPSTNTTSLLGANTGVVAVAIAATTLHPTHRFFTHIRKGVPIWVLLFLYILIDVASVENIGATSVLAHLGGALAGFLFIILLRQGKDGSSWMNRCYSWVLNIFTPNNILKNNQRLSDARKEKMSFSKKNIITQQRVDEILDKISSKGFHSLTDQEKDFLKNAGEEENL